MIEKGQLKPVEAHGPHPVYEGEDIRLLICGYGSLEAGCATAAFLGQYKASEQDWYFLYGSAGGITRSSGLYQLNRIHSEVSGRDQYPSLFLDLPSASVTCGPKIWNPAMNNSADTDLYDMESDGIFQAFRLFAKDGHCLLMRFVSDTGDQKMTPAQLKNCSATYADTFWMAVETLIHASDSLESSLSWSQEAQKLEDQLVTNLHASLTMHRQIHQLLIYALASGQDLSLFHMPPAKDRSQGKEMLHELSQRIAAKI